MVFSSNFFIFCFLPIVLILYYQPFIRNITFKNIILVLTSLFFYAWGEPTFVLILLCSIAVNWALGLWIDKKRHHKGTVRFIIALTALYNLSIIFVFKYLNFTLNNLTRLTGIDLTIATITLPIGISFFTFQAISYVLDVYRKRGEAQKNVLNVALYISFFPQLIAGPIVRYETVAYEIKNRKENMADFSRGVCRFVIGLAKKVLISNQVALIADTVFDSGPASTATAWIGAVAYALQIYYDFSGYSDMAIGLGWMFGFHFDENFNLPYISKSVSEFWRRWHISLGTWFRDYVYFPLGGSRVKSRGRLIFNLFVVWGLTGLWHGASWNFVLWGLYFFLFIAAEKLFFAKQFKENRFSLPTRCFLHLYTLLVVLFGWVLFRCPTLPQTAAFLKVMFGQAAAGGIDATVLGLLSEKWFSIGAALLFCLPAERAISRAFEKLQQSKAGGAVACIAYPALVVFLFAVSVSYLLKSSYNPFIYFNF